jgi:alpha-amylase
VTFTANNATTSWGENVYVVGDANALGAWNASAAQQLRANPYPTWTGTVFVPRNTTIAYKFVKKGGSSGVIWEGGGNRTFAVPNAATASTGGVWQ